MEQEYPCFKIKQKKGMYYVELWVRIGNSGGGLRLMISESYSSKAAAHNCISSCKRNIIEKILPVYEEISDI